MSATFHQTPVSGHGAGRGGGLRAMWSGCSRRLGADQPAGSPKPSTPRSCRTETAPRPRPPDRAPGRRSHHQEKMITEVIRWNEAEGPRRSGTRPAHRHQPGAAAGRQAGPATRACGSSACTPPADSSCKTMPGASGKSGRAAACVCLSQPESLARCRSSNSSHRSARLAGLSASSGKPEEQSRRSRSRGQIRPAASASPSPWWARRCPARPSDYLALPNVGCVGGSWLIPPAALAAGDYVTVESAARATHTLRSKAQ